MQDAILARDKLALQKAVDWGRDKNCINAAQAALLLKNLNLKWKDQNDNEADAETEGKGGKKGNGLSKPGAKGKGYIDRKGKGKGTASSYVVNAEDTSTENNNEADNLDEDDEAYAFRVFMENNPDPWNW